jgi:hypothetical protein
MTASSVACRTGGSLSASCTGLNSITVENNLWVASYDSSVTTAPTHATSGTSAVMQSNGSVAGWNSNDLLKGNLILGPLGVNTSVAVSGTTTVQPGPVSNPTLPTFTPVTNPGGVSQTPMVNGNVTWPGGTYYFTSFNIASGKSVTFSGPATVYMNGNMTGADNNAIVTSDARPQGLTWYQADGTTFRVGNYLNFTGAFVGGGAAFQADDHLNLRGGLFAKTITLQGANDIFIDTSLTISVGGSGGISVVK